MSLAVDIEARRGGFSLVVRFTAAEGANFHCEPMARQLVDQRMYDWLHGILAR